MKCVAQECARVTLYKMYQDHKTRYSNGGFCVGYPDLHRKPQRSSGFRDFTPQKSDGYPQSGYRVFRLACTRICKKRMSLLNYPMHLFTIQTPKLKRFRPYSGIISGGFPVEFRWISGGYPPGGFVINENKHSVDILCIETIIKDQF